MTLLDPNPNVFARPSRRLAAMHPTKIQADVMKPLPVEGPFDSAALNYVLHCLRGPQSNKAVAIRNVAAVLEPDGVLFGGSIWPNASMAVERSTGKSGVARGAAKPNHLSASSLACGGDGESPITPMREPRYDGFAKFWTGGRTSEMISSGCMIVGGTRGRVHLSDGPLQNAEGANP